MSKYRMIKMAEGVVPGEVRDYIAYTGGVRIVEQFIESIPQPGYGRWMYARVDEGANVPPRNSPESLKCYWFFSVSDAIAGKDMS